MHKGAIFPLFYLPPVEFFSQMKAHKEQIVIEASEHFPKQTYRNRASIDSPQGKLDLIVPVIKGSKVHTNIRDVKISYDFNWQRLHWMSIQTSYRRSAYFEFYEDAFARFYEEKWDYLFDYNVELLELLAKSLKLQLPYTLNSGYEETYPDMDDFRKSIHPKLPSDRTFKEYFQVFGERNGFLPNLSIIDLLFSQGPQSASFL
ncbi:MAG: WbqC family protein [Arcticibacter sp.]